MTPKARMVFVALVPRKQTKTKSNAWVTLMTIWTCLVAPPAPAHPWCGVWCLMVFLKQEPGRQFRISTWPTTLGSISIDRQKWLILTSQTHLALSSSQLDHKDRPLRSALSSAILGVVRFSQTTPRSIISCNQRRRSLTFVCFVQINH